LPQFSSIENQDKNCNRQRRKRRNKRFARAHCQDGNSTGDDCKARWAAS
jgi:hypothetical protein